MKSLKSSVKILTLGVLWAPSMPLYSMDGPSKPSAELATYVKLLIRARLNAPTRALMYALPNDPDVKMLTRYIDIVFDNYYELSSEGTPVKIDDFFEFFTKKALCKENLRKMFQVATCQETEDHLRQLGIVYDSVAPCTTWEQLLLILTQRAADKMRIGYA